MATTTFESYINATPAWTSASTNRYGFYSANFAGVLSLNSFQDSTHLSSATPGTDQCTTNHVPNTKPVNVGSGTSTVSLAGAAAVAITDANVAQTACTLRVHWNDATSYAIQNCYFYCFNGTTTTTRATGIQMYAWERGITAAQTWNKINDDTGSIGGNNAGSRLTLSNKDTPAADQYWYLCLGAAPLTVGVKTAFALGVSFDYY